MCETTNQPFAESTEKADGFGLKRYVWMVCEVPSFAFMFHVRMSVKGVDRSKPYSHHFTSIQSPIHSIHITFSSPMGIRVEKSSPIALIHQGLGQVDPSRSCPSRAIP